MMAALILLALLAVLSTVAGFALSRAYRHRKLRAYCRKHGHAWHLDWSDDLICLRCGEDPAGEQGSWIL